MIPERLSRILNATVRHVHKYRKAVVVRLRNRRVGFHVVEGGVVLNVVRSHASHQEAMENPVLYRVHGRRSEFSIKFSTEAAVAMYGALHDLLYDQGIPLPPVDLPLQGRTAQPEDPQPPTTP